MKQRMLAGAAFAALMVIAAPAAAASSPELQSSSSLANPIYTEAVSDFFAARHDAPLWLRGGDTAAAAAFIGILQRASLDGLSSGSDLATQAQALLSRAQSGDPAAAAAADRLLSTAWVEYVRALQTPPAGMTYADAWVAPRQDSAAAILARAAAAASLAEHVRQVSAVNPIYAQLRDAAWSSMQASGGTLSDTRILTSLERVRYMPPKGRFVLVDTAGAQLYMIENGRIADTMKVIVGKADAETQTPMLASTIYYATLNPYWHVSAEMVRTVIAKNVIAMGTGYLKSRGYEVMAPDGSGTALSPADVDWHAVAAGREMVAVRQLPGPLNSMGRIKFGFPNASDIFLHDTPNKALFASDDRSLSHGCIRLQDAERLGRWLMGREPQAPSDDPEQNVLLPAPVPIYLTYLTAKVDGGRLTFADDVYGRDAQRTVAALR